MTAFETGYDACYARCMSVFARTGSVDDLFQAADAISGAESDSDYRDVTLGKLARFFAERQQPDEASRFCSAIGDPLERADAVLRVAGTLLDAGRPDAGKTFLKEVATAANSTPEPSEAATTLLQAADLLEKTGEPAEAERLLRRAIELVMPASQEFESAKTLRGCARLLASWNRVPQAIAVAEAIGHTELRAIALDEVQGRGNWPITPGVRISER
jgi:tetratricopeptide (TPR) repeat protein